MRDQFTYADLAGRRRLRRFVFAAALILVFVGLLFGWAGWQQANARVERSTPVVAIDDDAIQLVDIDAESTEVVAAFITEVTIDDQPIGLATVDETVTTTPIPETEGCPFDPEEWELIDVYPDDNYKRIEPSCVYEGLSRAVAWHMLERLGYSKPEAAEQLGLPEIPWQPTQSITGLTNTKGPMTITLEMEWPPHPDFRTWVVGADGQSALVYSLRGCYRTRTLIGNQVESWGRYPVICSVAYDRDPGWTVFELGEHRFLVDLTAEQPQRDFALFAYTGDGRWVLLGEPSDRQMAIEEPSAAPNERERVAARYGAAPWDAEWLAATFGLSMRPLPENWQSFGSDPDVIQAIIDELNDVLQGSETIP